MVDGPSEDPLADESSMERLAIEASAEGVYWGGGAGTGGWDPMGDSPLSVGGLIMGIREQDVIESVREKSELCICLQASSPHR